MSRNHGATPHDPLAHRHAQHVFDRIRGTASTGLGYDPLMTRKSPVGGLRPAYRVYLVSFALGVAAVASFVAHVKVLGFVFVALMFAFAGVTTVMLLASARQAKADLRARPEHPGSDSSFLRS
jgi:hypothetical protein